MLEPGRGFYRFMGLRALSNEIEKKRLGSCSFFSPDLNSRALRADFASFLGTEQGILRKTVRNQSTENINNFVITRNKEQSILFPKIRLIPWRTGFCL